MSIFTYRFNFLGTVYKPHLLGTVYKPRRQVKGEGVAQMSTLLNKNYLVKVSTKGEGGQKCPKFCLRGLYTAP